MYLKLKAEPHKDKKHTPNTNSDIFIICTIETLVHYSKHFLYTEKMVLFQSPKWLQ